MIIINAVEGKKICLGRIGENEARAVRFDVSRILAEFPGASISVLNMRPSDPDAYPVNGQYIALEGSYLLWTLQSGDLAEDGLGECELKATLDGAIVKSIIWTTEICPALDGNGTPPEPWESWQQQVEADADRAEAAAELLEHPGAEAETLPAGSQATAGYADGVFTFGIPKGKDGLDGDTPTASVSKVGNTATITITDKDGTTTAQISDGTDGEDGFSPSASVTKSGKTATISITDKEGTTNAQITDGEDGEPGAVPIISIGTVTTLPAGSSATASMDTTDPEHPVLSMGIPKGDPGEVTEEELNGKADKVSNANANDLAALDGNGNLKDSAYSVDSYGGAPSSSKLWTSQKVALELSGKTDKVSSATNGNLAGLNGSGNLTDSGISASGLISAIDGKASIIHDSVSNVAIASVPDGAANLPLSALQIAVDPVQDLHGQANPYPAGGGKNLLPMSLESIKAINTTGTWSSNAYTLSGVTFTVQTDDGGNVTGITINGTASNNAEFNVAESITSLAGLTVILNGATDGSDSTYVLQAYHWNGTNSSASRTGDSVSFTPTSAFEKVRIVVSSGATLSNKIVKPMIRLSSVADGTFAPYSNLCPITGRTGCNVVGTGKNLVSNAQSASLGNNWQYFKTSGLRLKANTYTLSIVAETAPSFFYVRPFGQTSEEIAHSNSKNVTFTLAEEQVVWFDAYWVSGTGKPSSAPNIQLEVGSTASAYTPFVGQTYPISWETEAGIVYGCTIDPVTGELVVDKLLVTFNGTESWSAHGTIASWFYVDNAYPNTVLIDATSAYTAISNTYKQYRYNDSANTPNGCFSYGITGGTTRRLVVRDERFTTVTALQTEFSTNNLTICFDLATPITYQLDPVEIATLLGVNNLWADCGNILLMEYGCDTKGYIEKRLTASQNLMELIVTANRESELKASKAYSSGNLIIVNGTLYKATTSIANGATLTVGTNVTQTTVAAELAALA